jgi:hypothetical protein
MEYVRPSESFQPAAVPHNAAVERIYRDWDDALARNDAAALVALHAPDAVIESPLLPPVLGWGTGICRGREQINAFFQAIADRKPTIRRHYRTGYFTDGKTLMWEYPRATPEGEQMDFVEVMELNDAGLIQRHRVYWGWFGVNVLKHDAYHR